MQKSRTLESAALYLSARSKRTGLEDYFYIVYIHMLIANVRSSAGAAISDPLQKPG
jgi:hypothetical protein